MAAPMEHFHQPILAPQRPAYICMTAMDDQGGGTAKGIEEKGMGYRESMSQSLGAARLDHRCHCSILDV